MISLDLSFIYTFFSRFLLLRLDRNRFPGVQWAPLSTPLHRRIETLAVLHYVIAFVLSPFLCGLLPIYLCYRGYWIIVALYALWFLYDRRTPARGSREFWFMRSKFLWKPFADYFPITLEKTVDLDPERNYVFGSHPHGIFAMGSFLNFATDANDVRQVFPGITVHLTTLVGQFWYPLRREYGMATGAIESSRDSIEYMLTRHSKGRAVVVVVGGGSEIAYATPGCYELILKERKGFVKLALRLGADLVPVFNFGENEVYKQYRVSDDSVIRKIQVCLKRYCGFCIPVFIGRGIINYSFGLLPFRRPITTIVGKPILVEKTTDPSPEQVNSLHAKYVASLIELFETNKKRFGITEQLILH